MCLYFNRIAPDVSTLHVAEKPKFNGQKRTKSRWLTDAQNALYKAIMEEGPTEN
jgi:hypothetical protein